MIISCRVILLVLASIESIIIPIVEHFRQGEELGNQFFHIRRVTLTVLPRQRNRVENKIGLIELFTLKIRIERCERLLEKSKGLQTCILPAEPS